jgi:hypothetical protein
MCWPKLFICCPISLWNFLNSRVSSGNFSELLEGLAISAEKYTGSTVSYHVTYRHKYLRTPYCTYTHCKYRTVL